MPFSVSLQRTGMAQEEMGPTPPLLKKNSSEDRFSLEIQVPSGFFLGDALGMARGANILSLTVARTRHFRGNEKNWAIIG